MVSVFVCAVFLLSCGDPAVEPGCTCSTCTVCPEQDSGNEIVADVSVPEDLVSIDLAVDALEAAETTEPDIIVAADMTQSDTTGSDIWHATDVAGDSGSDSVQPVDAADATDTVPVPFFEKIAAVAANELINANAANSNFHILDVRTSGEFNGGHIAGAQNLDIYSSSFEQDVGKLSRTGIFLVYCASGSRSPGAIRTMQGLDFLTLYELSGGISSWKNAGYTTTKD